MEKPGGDLKRTQRIVPELYGLRVCLAYVTRPRGALGVVATRDGNQGPSPPQGGGVVHPPFPELRRVWGMHGRPRLGPTRRRARGVNPAGRITARPARRPPLGDPRLGRAGLSARTSRGAEASPPDRGVRLPPGTRGARQPHAPPGRPPRPG